MSAIREKDVSSGGGPPGASLVVLSGPRRGRTIRLTGAAYRIDPGAGKNMVADASGDAASDASRMHAASLQRAGESYEIVSRRARDLWVNGERIDKRVLRGGDLIELDSGTVLRFRLHPSPGSIYKTFAEIFSDCRDCARRDRRSMLRKTPGLAGALLRDIATQTSLRFRLGVSVALMLLGASLVWQVHYTQSLEQRFAGEQARVALLAELLQRAESRTMRKEDLGTLRSEVEQDIGRATRRLEALEARSAAARRIIAEFSKSVVFVQGGFGFREPKSGRALRYVSGPDGQPSRLPGGQPMVGLEAEGPQVEIQFMGTAFVARAGGVLLTNRHVARPWEDDATLKAIAALGVQPVMRRLVGYVPGEHGAVALKLAAASERFDLAMLQAEDGARLGKPFTLARESPSAGDEVLLLGYPTGIRALLARAGEQYVKTLAQKRSLDFWRIAVELSSASLIQPLATRGIVGQATPESVVYDAETTQGGSGGPVLNLDGEVVAVNTAIMREFGGSNFGVPASHARALLDKTHATERK